MFNGMDSVTFSERLIDLNMFILAIETSEFYVKEFLQRISQHTTTEEQNTHNLREIAE